MIFVELLAFQMIFVALSGFQMIFVDLLGSQMVSSISGAFVGVSRDFVDFR